MTEEQQSSRRRRRRVWVAALAALAFVALGLAMSPAPASGSKPDSNGVHKVTICHRTNSNTNPYVVITVDVSAADGSLGKGGNDHTHHDGPVWNPSLKDAHIKWGDIIPPYTYNGTSFPGMNWPAGQAIHENGCEAPPDDPCPTDSSVPANSDECPPPCPFDSSVPANSDECPPPCPFDSSVPANSDECPPPCPFDPSLPANSPQCPEPCPSNPSVPVTSPDCFGDA
jgi:hypothetical protein